MNSIKNLSFLYSFENSISEKVFMGYNVTGLCKKRSYAHIQFCTFEEAYLYLYKKLLRQFFLLYKYHKECPCTKFDSYKSNTNWVTCLYIWKSLWSLRLSLKFLIDFGVTCNYPYIVLDKIWISFGVWESLYIKAWCCWNVGGTNQIATVA